MSEKIHRREFRGFMLTNGYKDIAGVMHIMTEAFMKATIRGVNTGQIVEGETVIAEWHVGVARIVQPEKPAVPAAAPGTISREEMEQHMALLDAVESPASEPRPAVSVAGQAMADFESYRESCGEHARTPVPFGIFHLLWQRTRREKLSAATVAFALRRAEEALRH